MKKYLKEMIPAFIITFAFSFMLFIYEPLLLYLSNPTDFWFDIRTMFKYSFYVFSIFLFFAIIAYSLLYILQKKVFKKIKIYNILVIAGFCLFIIMYIEGNYLSGVLPPLDGAKIDWSSFTVQKIISFFVILVTIVSISYAVKKYKYEKTTKVLNYVTLSIVVMISVSLITTLLTSNATSTKKDNIYYSTPLNINKYSKEENLIVLLLDSIDSKTMSGIVNNNDSYKKVFNDFTYYPDTVGAYPFTRDNVPVILAGKWNENKEAFSNFSTKAMNESPLFKELSENNYDINVYYKDFYSNPGNNIDNMILNEKMNFIKFLKQELKYDMFKYFPFTLKKYSKIDEMNFNDTRIEIEVSGFKWENVTMINEYLNKSIDISNNKQFKYIHIEGAHYPFNVDSNFNYKEDGTYEDKMETAIKTISKYLQYLKDNGVYDNSTIIILSDHGFWWDTDDKSLLKRQNPIFYIKGKNEHHEMIVSDQKVSFDYLQSIYKELINGTKVEDLFNNIDTNGPRRFILYRVSGYSHFEEYLQYGHSNDFSTLEKTGNEYDLK